MNTILKWLDGKKAIIGTLILGILGILASTGTISLTNEWVQIGIIVVTTLTGISFRTAIKKSSPPKG